MNADRPLNTLGEGLLIQAAVSAGDLDAEDLEIFLAASKELDCEAVSHFELATNLEHLNSKKSAMPSKIEGQIASYFSEFKHLTDVRYLSVATPVPVSITLVFDLIAARRLCEKALSGEHVLSKFDFSDEIQDRLILISEDPALSDHFRHTSLDHALDQIRTTVSAVPGCLLSESAIIWTAVMEESEIDTLRWVTALGLEDFVSSAIVMTRSADE